MALSVNSPISIVSYNARGFRSGKAFITELLLIVIFYVFKSIGCLMNVSVI